MEFIMSIDNKNDIDQEQLREFKEALKQGGYQEHDFDIRSIENKQQNQQKSSFSQREQSQDDRISRMQNQDVNQQSQNKICVKCQKTGKEKTYEASNWVRDFKKDLDANQFK
jgi:hypothetical protein